MTDAEIHVRIAATTDGEEIGEAHAAAWLAAYDHIYDRDFLRAAAEGRRTGWLQSIHQLLVPPNLLLVGEIEGRVVGFAHAMPSPDTRRAEVRGFYCHPDAWGTGVATDLMTQCTFALGDDADEVFSWTLRDAGRARAFYERFGFCATGQARVESLTDWMNGDEVGRLAVEYALPIGIAGCGMMRACESVCSDPWR